MSDLKVSSDSSVAMPVRNLISIIAAVGIGVYAYFGLINRITTLETSREIMTKELETEVERITMAMDTLANGDVAQNTQFRIRWPRGELGALPADQEQFLLLEFLSTQTESIQEEMAGMMSNTVNINRLQQDVEKMLMDIEDLKNKVRANGASNGNN
jgi:hypothetical protein